MANLKSTVFVVAFSLLATSIPLAASAFVLESDQLIVVEVQSEASTQKKNADGTTASNATVPVKTEETVATPQVEAVVTKSPTWVETVQIIKNGETLKTEHWTLILTAFKSLLLIFK